MCRGACAYNRDCMNVAEKECVRCGIRYCSAECQKADWKLRHKNLCELKDIRRTETVFRIHKQRLDDYSSGKTSILRYYMAAMVMAYKEQFPLRKDPSMRGASYNTMFDGASGRLLSVLEEHELLYDCVAREGAAFVENKRVPPIPLSEQEVQKRAAEGLPGTEAVELVPLNKVYQEAYCAKNSESILRAMRKALYDDQRGPLFIIKATIDPGMGVGYGNPVFLNLKNTLAYEDYIQKNFRFGTEDPGFKFPMNLCCSILYPEFKFSMSTGNVAHDDMALGYCPKDEFVEKLEAPDGLAAQWATVFDEKVMKQEHEDEQHARTKRPGETQDECFERLWNYDAKLRPFMHTQFDMATYCSESLAVCPADQSAFAARLSNGVVDFPSEGAEGDDGANSVDGDVSVEEGASEQSAPEKEQA